MTENGPRRILIFGGWFGSRNAGDEAILIALRDLLSETFPGSELFAHTIDPEYTLKTCKVHPVSAPNGVSFPRRAQSLYNSYRSMDLFVVSGGTPIFDYYYLSRMFHFGIPILHRIPMIYLGIGLKPIRTWYGKLFYRTVLNAARFISARDPEVIEHLRGMGMTREISLTADSAVNLEISRSSAVQFLAQAGIDSSRPLVGICPIYLSDNHRDHYHEPVSAGCREQAYSSLAKVADELLSEGKQVVFIPMHQVSPDDDRVPIQQIVEMMQGQAFILEPPEDPQVVTAILASLDMLVGMRLHSLVLASSQNVPIVSIGFDMKVGGYIRYLGLSDFHREISEVNAEDLKSLTKRCWNQRDEIRSHLSKRMPCWRELIRSSLRDAASALG